MKPSERISQLHNEKLEELLLSYREDNRDAIRPRLSDRLEPAAIAAYLDEQHELAERRELVRWALAMVGPGASEGSVNEVLARAGLQCSVWECQSFNEARSSILHSARTAGLL